MKQLGYYFFKYWISFGLFFYFKKIIVIGLEDIPKNKPILLLSNHQNALLDVLLIATRNSLKPWYLTRSDVFKSKLFSPLFYFLQMIPIYRMRDGKDTLSKNQAIFNQCGELLNNNETLLIFPEADHNLKRRVRPLSKGFTRLLFNALEENPKLEIQLVPVGHNYLRATNFPDSTALYFGKPISVQDFLNENKNDTVSKIKYTVAEQLKLLTTNIEDEANYDSIYSILENEGVNFLYPKEVNARIKSVTLNRETQNLKSNNVFHRGIIKFLFVLLNLPIYLVWRVVVKPTVPEPEFMGTFRFVFSMLFYPIFYLLMAIIISNSYSIKTACLVVVGHAVLNFIFIKIGFTSSVQRK
ncbi:hypothetical protein MTsPCn9_00490 [Croceitalea sp. MTPC9]|uniref:lysophospholipid acyltransferase family protein n=1 Tax=unclassified Croceitalea TaxID=2632280 RepID=UPI002B37E9BA|nr:hypothetical protein MTsPCn6_08220 [Croceitalea sp. MTPC6]GMN15113.1 hypothetical protein MTsPCn9_00490 [Croceitalea sp. MTPC9]